MPKNNKYLEIVVEKSPPVLAAQYDKIALDRMANLNAESELKPGSALLFLFTDILGGYIRDFLA